MKMEIILLKEWIGQFVEKTTKNKRIFSRLSDSVVLSFMNLL